MRSAPSLGWIPDRRIGAVNNLYPKFGPTGADRLVLHALSAERHTKSSHSRLADSAYLRIQNAWQQTDEANQAALAGSLSRT
jgi:hypothetical protein